MNANLYSNYGQRFLICHIILLYDILYYNNFNQFFILIIDGIVKKDTVIFEAIVYLQ